jgi:NAD(P)-dependent dehydrogenase (short-subunit alcohol dehydrogenase family)
VNVLVTGASSGIGAATARAFAQRGDTVGVCARRGDRLAEVLTDLPGGKMWVVDLADLDGIDAFAKRVDDELGGIDVLVNNAGIPKRRRTTTMTADDVEGVMAINYFSPVRLTLAVLPRMVERGRGDIVNVSSMGVHLVARFRRRGVR